MLRALISMMKSAVGWCWWAAMLPLRLFTGGGTPAAPGVEAYEAEADAGPATPPATQPSAPGLELVAMVRQAAALRLASLDEGRTHTADDRLPEWASTWLSTLDADQLQQVMSMPRSTLADILTGTASRQDPDMDALRRLDSRPVSDGIADRIRARMASMAPAGISPAA